MEFSVNDRLGTYDGPTQLEVDKLIILRADTRRKDVRELHDIVSAFWHTDLPPDELLCIRPPCGEDRNAWAWQMRRTRQGTMRVSFLTSAGAVEVFCKCGYGAQKGSRQVAHHKQYD